MTQSSIASKPKSEHTLFIIKDNLLNRVDRKYIVDSLHSHSHIGTYIAIFFFLNNLKTFFKSGEVNQIISLRICPLDLNIF